MLKIICFFSVVSIIISENCTYSIHCKEDGMDDNCAIKKRTDSYSVFDVSVRKCSLFPCNIHDILLGDSEANTTCLQQENQYKNPSYPGGKCESDINCLSGVCQDNICKDSEIGEECFFHENCPLNSACVNGKCREYLREGESCSESYECQFDFFCNQKTKKCEKLFKYKDGEEITGLLLETENKENLCISGGFITLKLEDEKNHYFCETLKNIDLTCNDNCSYIKASDNEIFSSEDKCLCGYNKYRSKHCVLGNADPVYKDYLSKKKLFLSNKEFTQKCHTLERDLNDICYELVNTNLTVSFRNYVKFYNNAKILALQHHRLHEADSCIKEAVFKYESSPVFSLTQSCPIVTCNENNPNCLFGNNPLNENGTNITIKLNTKVCSQNEICSLSGTDKLIDTSLIMSREYLEGQCMIYQGNKGIKRYPGEECGINSDCKIEGSFCKNGKCTGIKEGDYCNKTEQCLVGFYCNKEKKICQGQKNEGETCLEGWDCKNYLGCYKKRCIKFGTIKKGVINTKELAPFPGEEKRNYLCNTGELNNGNDGDYCVENNYDEEWIKKNNKKIDDNGFIKCNYGESCFYDNGMNTLEKKCGCGYNSKGQGYCPLPSGRKLDQWEKRMKYIGETSDNKCHSLSRFSCYLQNGYNDYTKKRKYDKDTIEAHLFYDAVPCAEKMFVSGNYLKVNIIIFLFSLILVFT